MHTPCLALMISTLISQEGTGKYQLPSKRVLTTPYGLFQFNLMPFGLQGAPATFQRLMDRVVRGLVFTAAYLDDLIVFSETWYIKI